MPHGSRIAISDDPFSATIRSRVAGARDISAGDISRGTAAHFVAIDLAGEDFLTAPLIAVILDH